MDQPEIKEPPIIPDDPEKKYEEMRQSETSRFVEIFDMVRTGQITKDNQDSIIAELVEEKIDLQKQVDADLADPLMGDLGIYARKHFLAHLEALIEQINQSSVPARRPGEKFKGAVLFTIDTDNFKDANDKHGHNFGDEVLKHVGEVLKGQTKRAQDFIGRYHQDEEGNLQNKSSKDKAGRIGGDEFMVLLYDTDTQGAMKIIEEARRKLMDTPIITPDGQKFYQNVSIGGARIEKGKTVKQVIEESDSALYYSKTHGRNQTTMYLSGMAQKPKSPLV